MRSIDARTLVSSVIPTVMSKFGCWVEFGALRTRSIAPPVGHRAPALFCVLSGWGGEGLVSAAPASASSAHDATASGRGGRGAKREGAASGRGGRSAKGRGGSAAEGGERGGSSRGLSPECAAAEARGYRRLRAERCGREGAARGQAAARVCAKRSGAAERARASGARPKRAAEGRRGAEGRCRRGGLRSAKHRGAERALATTTRRTKAAE